MKRIFSVLTALGLILGLVGQARPSLMYWADQDASEILRANLDGSGQQVLVTGQSVPSRIALDVAAGQMYWTNESTTGGGIQRANLNGTGEQSLIGMGQVVPFGIALDIAGGRMYWTDAGSIGDIRRANLDGTGSKSS